MDSSDIKRGAQAWWVAGLLLLAFLLRFGPALIPHFWYDEICTVSLIHGTPRQIIKITSGDYHPPLYYFWVKCFAAAGRRLGGPFATLAWLRLASILPGLLVCAMGWWVARRAWGRRAGLRALALLALSPVLVYYSVELRSYSMIHMLLLAGLIGFMEAFAPGGARRRLGLGVFILASLAVFYVHSLSVLYLGAFGLLFLFELASQPGRWRRLIPGGMAAASMVLCCGAPWISFMFFQTGQINKVDYLNWAVASDLALTFFWYLPLGPWIAEPINGFVWIFAGVIGLVVGGLLINALLRRQALISTADGIINGNRLLFYCAVMTIAPLMVSFLLSHFQVAKTFMGSRYNLIAAPFYCLVLVGLIGKVRQVRLDSFLFTALLLLSALATLYQLPRRVTRLMEVRIIARDLRPEIEQPGARLYWTNPAVLPWLSRCGAIPIGSFVDALANPSTATGDIWLINHLTPGLYAGSNFSTSLLDHLLRHRGIAREPIKLWGWDGLWRLAPGDAAALAGDFRSALNSLEMRRRSIPGGQVLLADDPAFRNGWGWSCVEADTNNGLPQCWTEGPRQKLIWAGPEKPGQYKMKMLFWRANPYPEKEITIRHRLPGRSEWTEQRAGMGAVTIEDDVTVGAPGEKLRLDLEIPTWIPQKFIPGSNDPRALGMTFIALELRPM